MNIYIYKLDGFDELAGRLSIDSLDQEIMFEKGNEHRFYLTESTETNAPYVDLIVNNEGVPMAHFHFCVDPSPTELANFADYIRKREVVDDIADRWGDIIIDCPDKDPTDITTLYICMFGDVEPVGSGFTFLVVPCTEVKTYRDLIDYYNFIFNHFEASKNHEPALSRLILN